MRKSALLQIALASAAVATLAACSSGGVKSGSADITSASPEHYSGQSVQAHGVQTESDFQGTNTLSGYPANAPYASEIAALPKTVHFGFDQFHLNGQAKTVADQNVKFLLSHPNVHVMLAGNTDPRGSQEYNFHLGQRRADALKHYLLSQGVAANQICTVSYGELRPAATPAQFGGDWKKAYAQDRRTEIFYGKKCGGSGANV
jgi:peptidoglycan-associated lipoprotein